MISSSSSWNGARNGGKRIAGLEMVISHSKHRIGLCFMLPVSVIRTAALRIVAEVEKPETEA